MSDAMDTLGLLDQPEPLRVSSVDVGLIIAARYRVSRLIAEGGMATVYLAEDLRHNRMVAVKVLHEALTHTIGIQRFLREIEVVARLQHPHLLTLIDSGTTDGFPYYVMPYLEALSLRETIIERGQMPLVEAISITREIADGLAYAHERGVVHRDIKPSNILMSDGHAVVVDFGIATAIRKSSVGRITVTGSSLGSPTYMSPEQAAGEHDVDVRSDVYSLGCVLYELLTGRPPIDHVSMQHMLTQKLIGGHERVRTLRPDLPASVDELLQKALAPDRDSRYASMEEFSQAIESLLPTNAALSTRNRWLMAGAALLVVGGAYAYAHHVQTVAVAVKDARNVERLVRSGKLYDAFQLGERVLRVLPKDSALNALRTLYADSLQIASVPSGATVSVSLMNTSDTSWTKVGTTPIRNLRLPKFAYEKAYRVRLEKAGYETLDVQANIFINLVMFGGPRNTDTVHLDTVGLPSAGMARIPGFTFRMTGSNTLYQALDYHIGKREVTNREYMRFVAAGGYTRRDFWADSMLRDGKLVTWEAAMTEFRDQSGRAGPATWKDGTYVSGQEEFPVGGVSWYEASAYARFAGMQLPTNLHWTYAQRNEREAGWTYGLKSNLNGTGPRRTGLGTMSVWGLYDVQGNVREWNANEIGDGRLTRGGTWEDSPFQTTHRIPRPAFDRLPGNGFRLAYYNDADSIIKMLSERVERTTPRDFRQFVAVNDAEYAGYVRMYAYDKAPLDTKLEASGELADARWQKVSFNAGYRGPRMAAYLIFPKNKNGPFEPVIMWEAAGALASRQLIPEQRMQDVAAGFIARNGRMMVIPLYLGSYERRESRDNLRSTPDSTSNYRDITVQWIKDLRRTVDFLESRPDVLADRIGYYGISWGGLNAPIALAMEPRIKAAVLFSAGFVPGQKARDEIDEANYAPHVHTPVLMLNGKYDTVFPQETSQIPMFNQLGTPAADKRMVKSNSGHVVSMDTAITESLKWFDKYLSGRKPLTATKQ